MFLQIGVFRRQVPALNLRREAIRYALSVAEEN